jgi:thymidylate kinase
MVNDFPLETPYEDNKVRKDDDFKNSIKHFFDICNKHNINYALLHGFLPIETLNTSNDIDIYVASEDLKKLDELLISNSFFRINSFNFFDVRRQYYFFDNTGHIKIDIVTDFLLISHKGIYKISNLSIIQNKNLDIKTLTYDSLFKFYLFRLFVEKNTITDRHNEVLSYIYQYLQIHENNNKNIELYEAYKKGSIDINYLINNDYIFKYKISFYNRVKSRIIKIYNSISKYSYQKDTLLISFVGLDGSGKSTLVDYLSLKNNLPTKVVYMGHKDYEISLLKLFNKYKKSQYKYINKLSKFIYIAFWPIELRYRLTVASKGMKMIIMDRHPYFEPVVENRFYKFYENILVPRPHTFIVLTGDAKILWNRKKETTFENYKLNLLKLTDKQVPLLCEKITIQTDGDINQTKQDLLDSFSKSKQLKYLNE